MAAGRSRVQPRAGRITGRARVCVCRDDTSRNDMHPQTIVCPRCLVHQLLAEMRWPVWERQAPGGVRASHANPSRRRVAETRAVYFLYLVFTCGLLASVLALSTGVHSTARAAGDHAPRAVSPRGRGSRSR